MNAMWLAAQALLALVIDCISANCDDYARTIVDTAPPVFDCSTISVVIGNAKAHSGSCVGRSQLKANLDIHIVRCCEPVGELGTAGYTPPPADEIEAAAACLARDVWSIFECIACSACSTLSAVNGVTACCDDATGPPEIIWQSPAGGCRSAIVRVPVVFTTCCE